MHRLPKLHSTKNSPTISDTGAHAQVAKAELDEKFSEDF